MKTKLIALTGLLLWQTMAFSQVYEELGTVTEVLEVNSITMSQGLGGQISYVTYQACENCPVVKVRAAADLQVYHRANVLSEAEALAFQGASGGVTIDTESGKAIELSF